MDKQMAIEELKRRKKEIEAQIKLLQMNEVSTKLARINEVGSQAGDDESWAVSIRVKNNNVERWAGIAKTRTLKEALTMIDVYVDELIELKSKAIKIYEEQEQQMQRRAGDA